MLNKLEALADAIAWHNAAHEITTRAYINRNPGCLAAFSLKQERDADNQRIFASILDGYQALLFDLRVKCSGKSRALPAAALIADLANAYGISTPAAQSIAKRVRKALGTEVTVATPLTFFLS